MSIKLDKYNPLIMYLSPASIPQIVAHIQDYLVKHPILSVETIAEIIVQSLQEHPELINGEAIPISADSQQSIKAYIDALPFLDTYTKAEINTLLLGKQDTLTFDQAPTPGSSNPVTSSGIIAAMSALQSALETQISNKADRASTYTKTQVDTLLEDKANADDVYSKNTMDAKLLEVNNNIDNLDDELNQQSQQIDKLDERVDNLETDISLISDGDTHPAINPNQYVIVKNHSSLSDGLYYNKTASVISASTALTINNLERVEIGGLNHLLETRFQVLRTVTTDGSRTYNSLISELFSGISVPNERCIIIVNNARIFHCVEINAGEFVQFSAGDTGMVNMLIRIIVRQNGEYYEANKSFELTEYSMSIPASGNTFKLIKIC